MMMLHFLVTVLSLSSGTLLSSLKGSYTYTHRVSLLIKFPSPGKSYRSNTIANPRITLQGKPKTSLWK